MSISKQEIDFVRANCQRTRDEFEELMKKAPQCLDDISLEIRSAEKWISERCNQKGEKSLIWATPELRCLATADINIPDFELDPEPGLETYTAHPCALFEVSTLVWGTQYGLFQGRSCEGDLDDPPRIYYLRSHIALRDSTAESGKASLAAKLNPNSGTLQMMKAPGSPKKMERDFDQLQSLDIVEFLEGYSYGNLLQGRATVPSKTATVPSKTWFRWLIDAPVKYRIEGFKMLSSLQDSVLDSVVPPNLRSLIVPVNEYGLTGEEMFELQTPGNEY